MLTKEKDVSFAHNSLTALNSGHSLQTAAVKRVRFKLNTCHVTLIAVFMDSYILLLDNNAGKQSYLKHRLLISIMLSEWTSERKSRPGS